MPRTPEDAGVLDASPVKPGRQRAYGCGDFGFLLVWQGSALFLLFFYTDVLGLPAWMAGTIYLAGMIWDSLSDPIVATWAERRARRTGQYAPILAASALPVGLSYFAMFTASAHPGALTALLALASHLAFRTAYTFASMPYNALLTRLTSNSDARSSLSAVRVSGAAFGGLFVAIATPLIVQMRPEGSGYAVAAAVVGSLAALLLLACAHFVREEPAAPARHSGTQSFRADLLALARYLIENPPLRSLMLVMALGTAGYGLFTHDLLYVVTHVMARPDLATLALAAPAVTVIFAAPIWSAVSHRTSKRLTLIAGLLLAAAGYAAFGLTSAATPGLAVIAIAVIGTGSAAIPVMLWSMLPDVIDFGQLHTGMRVEARTFGLATFVQKTAAGVAALFAGSLLSASGYVAGEAPTILTLAAMNGLASWLPALTMLSMAWVIRSYPIDRATHRDILSRIARSGD